MAKKPFKETKLGKFLQSKGFNTVLDAVGNVIPGVGVLDNVKDILMGNNPDIPAPPMTPEDKAYALELLKQEQAQLDSILADVKDARNLQVQMNQSEHASWLSKNITSLIAIFMLLVCTTIMLLIGYGYFEDSEATIRSQTWSENATIMILTYFFGSTMKSRQKDETIQAMTRK